MNINNALKYYILPPFFVDTIKNIRRSIINVNKTQFSHLPREGKQFLDIYSDETFAEILETWGEEYVWHELKLVFSSLQGKVLDVACGSGASMIKLMQFQRLDLYGVDISELLIKRAITRGIRSERLSILDATRMNFAKDFFEYAYSVGSLEHFTEEGIRSVISHIFSCTSIASFHFIPCSSDNVNHGWIRNVQDFYNNSVDWWLEHFLSVYNNVVVIDSGWRKDYAHGKWFLCYR